MSKTNTNNSQIGSDTSSISESVTSKLSSISCYSSLSQVEAGLAKLYIDDIEKFNNKIKGLIKRSTDSTKFLDPNKKSVRSKQDALERCEESIKIFSKLELYHSALDHLVLEYNSEGDTDQLVTQIEVLKQEYRNIREDYRDILKRYEEKTSEVEDSEDDVSERISRNPENVTQRKKISNSVDLPSNFTSAVSSSISAPLITFSSDNQCQKTSTNHIADPLKSSRSRYSAPLAGMIYGNAGSVTETITGQLPPALQPIVSGAASTSLRYSDSYHNPISHSDEINYSVYLPRNEHLLSSNTPNTTKSRGRNETYRGFSTDPAVFNQESHPGTETLIRMDESWRNFEIESNNLSELALLKTIRSISKITVSSVNNKLSDSEVITLNKNKRPIIERLIENLKREVKDVPDNNQMLKAHAVEAFKSASGWLDNIEDLMNKSDLYLASDRKYSEPLELVKFQGHDDKYHIYEFLRGFEVVSRGLTQEEKGLYLFNNYLEDDPKRVVKHIRDNFIDMKRKLIDKFGNVNRLLSNKKNQIKSLPNIFFRSSKQQKLDYIRGFTEVLDQIQSLVELNVVDYPAMEVEIFSHSNVMELSALLPGFLYEKFSNVYVEERKLKNTENIPGRKSFQLLRDMLMHEMDAVEFAMENYVDNIEKKNVKGTESKKEDKKGRDHNQVLHMKTTQNKEDKFIKSVCFVHKDRMKKVSDCRTGKCQVFLSMKPKDRLDCAKQKNLCCLCFLFKCTKKSLNKCFYKSQVPVSLICKGCASNDVERNVLLCGEHNNNNPDVLSALPEMLVGFDEGTSITLNHFMPESFNGPHPIMKTTTESKSTGSIETRTNPNVFDVTNGGLIDKSEVLHRINQDSKEYAVYPMQILNISGHQTLVLYDSGAMGEAITADLANKVGMTIIDSRPQSFRVAGGAVVNTNNPLYETTIGPDENDEYHSFPLLGMECISEKIPLIDLSEIVKEFRKHLVSSPLSKEMCPNYVGGSNIGMIIGIRQSLLFPTRLMVLPNGLQVWRSPIKDIFNSNLIFAGPHASIKNAYNSCNLTTQNDSFTAFFHSGYNLYRDLHSFIPPVNKSASQGTSVVHYESIEDGFIPTNNIPARDLDSDNNDEDTSTVDSRIDIPFLLLSKSIDSIPNCKSVDESIETKLDPISDKNYDNLDGVYEDLITSDDNAVLKDRCFAHANCIDCLSMLKKTVTFFRKGESSKPLDKTVDETEEDGAIVDYRCPRCAECKDCLTGNKLRNLSIREEAEEVLIKNSITIDIKNGVTRCVYPFSCNPDTYLRKKWGNKNSNIKQAESVLRLQRNKPIEVRESVLKFHEEIYSKNYVSKLKDLPLKLQNEIMNADFQHFFCWRSVFKQGSISTPARLVVDPTVSSFNETIVKGVNCLTNLFTIVLNFRSFRYSFCSDISKMYNTLKLMESMYKYSLYLFSTSLDPKEDYEIMVIRTIMYGIKSGGNQATHALRRLADIFEETLPLAHEIIHRLTYMDDSSGGANDEQTVDKMINEVKELLPHGGFQLKVVCRSGEEPSEKASSDGVSTTFGGYRWHTKEDLLLLNSSEINFNPRRRGVKRANDFPVETDEDVEKLVATKKLTRRVLIGKTLELFDIAGILEPLKARLKIDLQPLKNLGFDEEIPVALCGRWLQNIKMLNNARNLTVRRTIIPENCVNPDEIEILTCSDAAATMCGAATYARLKLTDGSYSCQLLAAKSKSCSSTIPRNELIGCALAAQLAFIVSKTLGSRVKKLIFASDSTISICWIANTNNKLRQFVNTRVKIIHRLVGNDKFYHIRGEQNPADLLTRGNVDCCDVDINSIWQTGHSWMHLDFADMPLKSYADLCSSLSNEEKESIGKESHPTMPIITMTSEPESPIVMSLFSDPLDKGKDEADCEGKSCNCTLIFDNQIRCKTEDSLDMMDGVPECNITKEATNDPDDITIGCGSVDINTEDVLSTEIGTSTVSTNIDITVSTRADEVMVNPGTPKEKDIAMTAMRINPVQSKFEVTESNYVVDLVKFGFEKGFLILAIMFRFILRAKHRAHISKGNVFKVDCRMCNIESSFRTNGLCKIQPLKTKDSSCNDESRDLSDGTLLPFVVCSPLDFYAAWHFLCKEGTKEVKEYYKGKSDKLNEYTEKDGVLFGAGRLSHSDIRLINNVEIPIFSNIDFFQPVFLFSSAVTYALCMHTHWKLCPHSGVDRTITFVSNIIHVSNLRKIVKFIRETCLRCRYLMRKFLTPITGNQSMYSLYKAPPFYTMMMDIAGTFLAHDSVKRRTTRDAFFLVQVCLVTGATSIGVMEDLSVTSVIMAMTRTADRYGWPKFVILDNQSSFKKLNDVSLTFKDLRGRLWKDQRLILDFSTPMAHNEHGRVESKVKALKEYINKAGDIGQKHSFLEWETIVLNVAAIINGLPICHNQDDRGIHNDLGLLTPNMFLIGRNNIRSPDAILSIEFNPPAALKKLAEMDDKLFDLLGDYAHRFIPGKRMVAGDIPEVEDVVMFISKENQRSRNIKLKYGRIVATMVDGRQNKVKVEYQNASEAVKRIAERSVKDLIKIKGVDEVDFNTREHQLASAIQRKFCK